MDETTQETSETKNVIMVNKTITKIVHEEKELEDDEYIEYIENFDFRVRSDTAEFGNLLAYMAVKNDDDNQFAKYVMQRIKEFMEKREKGELV